MTNTFNLLLALVIGGLLLVAAPLQARAQFVQVNVDEIVAGRMTDDDDPFNTCDDVYFLLAGASSHDGPIEKRIGPCGSPDVFRLCPTNLDTRTKRNIRLWKGYVANGQSAFLTVVVREQDNDWLPFIFSLLRTGASALAAIFIDPALGPTAVNDLKNAATAFVDSFSNDTHDTIGAFTIRITNQNNNFTASWDTVRDTNIVSQSATSAHFNAFGADSNYSVNVSIQPLTLTESGNLLWYKNNGWLDGSRRWANGSSRRVEQGWQNFLSVFATSDGVIYGIMPNGELRWYKHEGYEDGVSGWACNSGAVVGNGWAGFRSVFATSDGVIYAINTSGELLWYKHEGWTDGTRRWANRGEPRVVGRGWGGFRSVFATSDGVIYAINTSSNLLWYKHEGWTDGTWRYAPGYGAVVGRNWQFIRSAFATSDGVIYGIHTNGNLLWYKHDRWTDGLDRWATGSGSLIVGNGWAGFRSVFATSDSVIYGVLP